ncbi:hypothetical protein JL193_04860 [Polaribacter batillariae]|uniref:Uncharacterized protein n=1 Tax=Polaribacter batillariae TaxID=2808900 RepID=A0ABX7SWI4_9FLAO|nr:hypothetical protein [Polaribacter batillariae]QTD38612.1 hypothetical protein JL193_04860 [Polaribacter batillariae]
MNSKWYLSAFLFICICFGVFQEQVYKPNQEIVLEFIDTSSQNKNIENTISEVQKKLVDIGVTNIAIQKTEKGTLKISYYSIVNVNDVKKALTKEHRLSLNKNSKKENENRDSTTYSIDIYELTNKLDISNLDDKFIFEIEPHSDRFTTNNIFCFYKVLENQANQLFKTAYKANKTSLYIKDYTSYQEPEVRAGPQKYFA